MRTEQNTMQACETFMNIPELLGLFFAHCLPDETVNPSFTTAPLQLILVCQLWKDIVEDMPEMWSRFRLDLRPEEGRLGIEKCSRVLTRFLLCSRSRPLDVGLLYPYDNEIPQAIETALRCLYAILRTQRNRWSDITFQLPLETFNSEKIQSSSLRRLHLDVSSNSLPGLPPSEIHPTLVDCPSLVDVVLIGRHIEEEYESDEDPQMLFLYCPPSLPSLELRSVYIYTDMRAEDDDYLESLECWGTGKIWKLILIDVEIYSEDLYGVFPSMFPSLSWLEIRHPHNFRCFEPSWYGNNEALILKKLRHLGLLIRKWEFLNAFGTPNVISLDLEEGRHDVPNDDEKFGPNSEGETYEYSASNRDRLDSTLVIAFIERNHLFLQVFKLTAATFDEQELIKSLTYMPSLKELRVMFQDAALVSDQLLLALSERSETRYVVSAGRIFVDSCRICPALATFVLTVDTENFELSNDAVAGLIKSRQTLAEDGEHRVIAWKELALPITTEDLTLFRETFATNLCSTLGHRMDQQT